jgi:hypothetical protein
MKTMSADDVLISRKDEKETEKKSNLWNLITATSYTAKVRARGPKPRHGNTFL